MEQVKGFIDTVKENFDEFLNVFEEAQNDFVNGKLEEFRGQNEQVDKVISTTQKINESYSQGVYDFFRVANAAISVNSKKLIDKLDG